jgi:hypothetical protein
MLHHADLKIFFELMHMFELVWIWIENPREKNRKAIRKFQEKVKAISAQLTQSSQPRARPHLRTCLHWHVAPACQPI